MLRGIVVEHALTDAGDVTSILTRTACLLVLVAVKRGILLHRKFSRNAQEVIKVASSTQRMSSLHSSGSVIRVWWDSR